jgi:hypothetical protein
MQKRTQALMSRQILTVRLRGGSSLGGFSICNDNYAQKRVDMPRPTAVTFECWPVVVKPPGG